MLRLLPTVALVLLLASALVPAQPAPQIRVAPVSAADARRPAEASVAINPTNPEHVIATFIQSTQPGQQPRSTNWGYVSTDGGLTWTGTMAANHSSLTYSNSALIIYLSAGKHHKFFSGQFSGAIQIDGIDSFIGA